MSRMQGFDAEFRDLDHYIRVITDRIWEGRRLDDIRRYYAEDCVVETPSGITRGIQPVIDGTAATLVAFPDRRLLAEEVIESGDAQRGFLSSHRIASPMTHAGGGRFGAPSGRPVFVRTVADCVCRDNRIVHEWLVRDQAAIARQIGLHERSVAQRWLDADGALPALRPTVAPAPYVTAMDASPAAQAYADAWRALWSPAGTAALAASHQAQVIAALPRGEAAVGLPALQAFWAGIRASLPDARASVEHLALNERPGRAGALAMRWRLDGTHAGAGRWGEPTGRRLRILGITHADLEGGRALREWVMLDEVAVWMQLLQPAARREG